MREIPFPRKPVSKMVYDPKTGLHNPDVPVDAKESKESKDVEPTPAEPKSGSVLTLTGRRKARPTAGKEG